MTSNLVVTIPARFKSSRLPGKPLKMINGKSMIHHVWDICIKAAGKKNVFVLTDSDLIQKYCHKNLINVYMTSEKCKTGTDRIYEFAKKNKYTYYINVQGDEPLLNPEHIKKVIRSIKKYKCLINCYSKCTANEYLSLNIPKVVVDNNENLIYMSRAPIPATKNKIIPTNIYKQICIYGFTYNDLIKFGKFGKKSRNEQYEDIEILRFLDFGSKIKMLNIKSSSIAVDTISDLNRVRKIFADKFKKS